VGDGHGARERARDATREAVTPHGAKVRQGQERARARGVHVGRPCNPTLTRDVLERARAMRAAGIRVREIASALGVPKSTLHRALRREVQRGDDA
jgi:DNA invertase Pin-like site-specific DNA recombinase